MQVSNHDSTLWILSKIFCKGLFTIYFKRIYKLHKTVISHHKLQLPVISFAVALSRQLQVSPTPTNQSGNSPVPSQETSKSNKVNEASGGRNTWFML